MNYKHELVIPNEGVPFRIFEFEGKEGNYSVAEHWHRNVELFTVNQGNITFYINSTKYLLKEGDSILVNANEIHSIEAPEKNQVIVLQVQEDAFDRYGDGDDVPFKQIFEYKDAYVYQAVNKILEELTSQVAGNEFIALGIYYTLLGYLFKTYRDELDPVALMQKNSLSKLSYITDYIMENYRSDLKLEDVAKTFGFAPSYLSRLFKKTANINYKSFVDSIRLQCALKELLNTDKKLGDIALENGFPNIKSFIVSFKKKYEMTPSQYRKMSKNDN